MSIEGDYGWVNNRRPSNTLISTERRSQVFQATHDGEGNLLPSRLRSFISFSFGGRNIEDFNLIACCEGDTMTRRAYSEFEDLTSDYDIMDGQYYHGTHYKPNTLSLRLVSDDLDQKQLDEFLYWFQGGRIRELIFAEHPNRAIMARVAAAPELDVLPFEKVVDINFGGQTFQTSTTLYKGFITLDLVADMPFWYAKQNLFVQDEQGNTLYGGKSIYSDTDLMKEALKISYEDTVPLADIVSVTMQFGEDYYASIMDNSTAYAIIAAQMNQVESDTPPATWEEGVLGYFTVPGETEGKYYFWKGARTSRANGDVLGRIAGAAILSNDTNGVPVDIPSGNTDYKFFYGGNAPSPTMLSFDVSFEPTLASGSSTYLFTNGQFTSDKIYNYIDCFANTYAKTNDKEYSTITIKSEHEKHFDITIPNVMMSWNKAKKIIDNITPYNPNGASSSSDSGVTQYTYQGDLADTFRDQIRHPAVRAWAVGIINYLKMDEINTGNQYITEEGYITSQGLAQMKAILPIFFMHPAGEDIAGVNKNEYPIYRNERLWEWNDAHFEFNAETGEATMDIYYWWCSGIWNVVYQVLKESDYTISNGASPSTYRLGHANFRRGDNSKLPFRENVGDMLRSNWLLIEDHNIFDNNGMVSSWTNTPVGRQYSHYLTHNANATLKNVKLKYKNMYL